MRIKYVDEFRGLALLIMMFIQIYDALAKTSIYTDPPFFVKEFDMVTLLPPSILFSFVSGISVYLLLKNRKNYTKKELFYSLIKRYGIYILISLPFTTFMWGLTTYLQWNEAIQGIALSGIILGLIIIFLAPSDVELILSAMIITLIRHYLMKVYVPFPYTPKFDNTFFASLLLNMIYRGWFSITNLLPLMIGGILFFKIIKRKPMLALIVGGVILGISLTLHFTGLLKIDYYRKSINMTIYGIGSCFIVFGLIYFLRNKLEFLSIIGLASLFLYISHNVLLLKPLYVFYRNKFDEVLAFIFAIPWTFLFCLLGKIYIDLRHKNKT